MDRRYLNINDLSEYIGISKQTIYQWVSQCRIPFIKIGRLRFDKDRIDRWIKEKSVEPKNF